MSSAPSGDSEGDEEETTQDEVSSHTSEEDGGVVKVEKELENAEQPVGSGNEVVEHEASGKQPSSRQLSLPSHPAPLRALTSFQATTSAKGELLQEYSGVCFQG